MFPNTDYQRGSKTPDAPPLNNFIDTRIKQFLIATWDGQGKALAFVIRFAETTEDKLTLMELAQDADPEVRAAVADNRYASTDTVHRLSLDPHADVRYTVAENAHTPTHILRDLMDDENPYVSNRAGLTLKHLEYSQPMNLRLRRTERKAFGS